MGYVNSLEGTLTAAMYFLLSVIFHLLPSFLHNVPLTGRIPLTRTKALDLAALYFQYKKGKNGFFTPKNFHDFAGFHLALSRISSLVSTVLAGFQQKPTLLASLLPSLLRCVRLHHITTLRPIESHDTLTRCVEFLDINSTHHRLEFQQSSAQIFVTKLGR